MSDSTNFSRTNLSFFISFMLVFIIGVTSAFSDTDDVGMTGLPELTQEELEWQNKHMLRVKKVKLNKLGLERINAHRQRMGKKEWEENDFSIMPLGKEIDGVIDAPEETSAVLSSLETALIPETLPSYVDNSALKYFPPIRSQGSLPSCGAFSGTYYTMTYMHALARDLDAKNGGDDFRFSPKWTYNMLNDGVNAGTWYYSAYDIGIKHGAASWSEFPYDSDSRAWCLDPFVWRNAIERRFDQYGYVANTHLDAGMEQVKQMLLNGYVLNIATYISSWQYRTIGDDPSVSEDDAFVGKSACYWVNGTVNYHAMTVVGYNDHIWVDINGNGSVDAGEKGAFRIANSWGTGWGEAGFSWIAYDALRSTSAVSGGPETGRISGWSPTRAHWVTARSTYNPTLIAEFTLHHARRNQLRMTLGVADPQDGTPSQQWLPKMIYADGGAYAFDGSTTACDGTFVFDFTDIVPPGGDYQRYFLGVYDALTGDAVTVKDYRIIDVTDGNNAVVCATVPLSGDNEQLYPFVEYNFSDGNIPPVAHAEVSALSGTAPLTVSFDAGGSYDEDGTIVSYNWDFGDGGIGTGITVDHTFTNAGSYDVTLTVTDNQASTNEFWLTIAVAADPGKILYVDDIAMVLQPTSRDITVKTDVVIRDIDGNLMENAAVSGQWSGLVRGDVSGVTDASGTVSFVSSKTKKDGLVYFSINGVSAPAYTYDETLNNETQDSISTVESVNQKPVAHLTASSTTGVAPFEVFFDGTGSSDPDGQIVSYNWDLGNGSTAPGDTTSVVYDVPGSYKVTLTVTDDQGETDTATVTITVTADALPVVHVQGLWGSITLAPGGSVAEVTVFLADTDGNAMADATVSAEWGGLVSGTVTGMTSADGTLVLSSKKTRKSGIITLTIADVTAAGYIYDPSLNTETSVSITAP